MNETERDRTIADFGAQWIRFTDNSGYYGSLALFEDIAAPLLTPADVAGRQVADVGSGTGRIVAMVLAAGAERVTALEPSQAFEVLSERFAGEPRVDCRQLPGEGIASLGPFDLVVSFGVLHHIPEPLPVVRAIYAALRPGGRLFAWLYGREGNGAYLAVAQPLRALTKRMPDPMLDGVVRALDLPLAGYIALCRRLPLPMAGYMREHLGKLAADKRRLTIFDQLNPAYAKYYRRDEAEALFLDAGFTDVRLHHRHGYSWSVIGTKPAGD
jgi:SAM-dependent methyltransferase